MGREKKAQPVYVLMLICGWSFKKLYSVETQHEKMRNPGGL